MQPIQEQTGPDRFVLHLGPVAQRMSDDEFFDFCQRHPDLRIELTSEGDLIIRSPTGGETGRSNFTLSGRFFICGWKRMAAEWASILRLNSSYPTERSAPRTWRGVRNERWAALTPDQRRKFPPLCPGFVIELRSDSDRLSTLQKKMREYIDNGTQLGWLIDPLERKDWVYRQGEAVQCLENPASVSGDPILPGFVLVPGEVWQ